MASSGHVSADGRFIAFDSDAGGEFQVDVRPLSSEGERVTVTAKGGRWPVWSRDGRTLFFRRGRQVLALAAMAGGGIRFGEERVVLEWDVARSFDVGPDGTFYGVEPVPGAGVRPASRCRRAGSPRSHGWPGPPQHARLTQPFRRKQGVTI